ARASAGAREWERQPGEHGPVRYIPARRVLLPRGSALRLQRWQVRELAAQHRLAVTAEPGVEQRGINLAEVGVVLQVARVEVLQAGMLAHRPTLERRTRHEQAGAGPVVGPLA